MRKKSYIFGHNHHVTMTKKPLQALINSGELNDAMMVAFPLQTTSCSYIAVDGSYLSDLKFTSAEMTYQLAVRKDEHVYPGISEMSTLMHDDAHTVWRYWPVTAAAATIEEFYHLLSNIFFYVMPVTMQQCNDENGDYIDYVDLEQVRIRILYHGKISQEYTFTARQLEEIPFETTAIQVVSEDIAKQFGILNGAYVDYRQGRFRDSYPLVIWDRKEYLYWNQVKKFELTNDVFRVFIPWDLGFMVMKMEEYDQALTVDNTRLYVHIIHSGIEDEPHSEVGTRSLNYLSISAFYKIPRWSMNNEEALTSYYYDAIAYDEVDLKAFEFYNGIDAFILLEALPAIMTCYREAYRALLAVERGKEPQDFPNATIILTEMYMDVLSTRPEEKSISIVTDNYQRDQPTAKELCMVLKALENGDKLPQYDPEE